MSLTTAHFYSWACESGQADVPDDVDVAEQNEFDVSSLVPGTDYNIDWGDGSSDVVFIAAADGTSTYAVTNKALTSNVATLTSASHGFAVNDVVLIAGVDATFNGTFTVTAVTANTFSYSKTHADVPSAAVSPSGTATEAIHTYSDAGLYDITITDVTTEAVVARSQVAVQGTVSGSFVKLVPADLTLADFANNEDYQIDFGDGTDLVDVTTDGSGGATVAHIYYTADDFDVVVYLPGTTPETASGTVVGTATVTAAAFTTVTDNFTAADSTALDGKSTTAGSKTWADTAGAFDIQSNRASSKAAVGSATINGPVNGLVQAVYHAPVDGVGIVAMKIDANNYVFFGQRDDVSATKWVGREVRTKTNTISNKALTSNIATLTTAAAHGYKAGDTVVVDCSDNVFDGTYVVLARNEKQTVEVDATGGTFTLTFDDTGSNPQTTSTIAANAAAATVQSALEGLSNIAPGDVAVTRSGSANDYTYTIEFTGTYALTDVNVLVSDPALLTGGAGTATVATSQTAVAVGSTTFSYALTHANVVSAAATGTVTGHYDLQTKVTTSDVTADDTLKITFVDGVCTFFVNGTSKGSFTNAVGAAFIPDEDSGVQAHGFVNEKGTAAATLDDFSCSTL